MSSVGALESMDIRPDCCTMLCGFGPHHPSHLVSYCLIDKPQDVLSLIIAPSASVPLTIQGPLLCHAGSVTGVGVEVTYPESGTGNLVVGIPSKLTICNLMLLYVDNVNKLTVLRSTRIS